MVFWAEDTDSRSLRKFVTCHKSSVKTQKDRDRNATKPPNVVYDLLVIGGFAVFIEVTAPPSTLTCNKEKRNKNRQKHAVKCS